MHTYSSSAYVSDWTAVLLLYVFAPLLRDSTPSHIGLGLYTLMYLQSNINITAVAIVACGPWLAPRDIHKLSGKGVMRRGRKKRQELSSTWYKLLPVLRIYQQVAHSLVHLHMITGVTI